MGELVQLYVYDMSRFSHKGLRRSTPSAVGFPLVYHTSIVVFGKEYSFNSTDGITLTPLYRVVDKPDKTHKLGYTKKTKNQLEKFLEDLRNIRFQAGNYDLLKLNCQEFCIKLCEFLGVAGLPEYIRTIPRLARNSFGSQTGLIVGGVGVIGALSILTNILLRI